MVFMDCGEEAWPLVAQIRKDRRFATPFPDVFSLLRRIVRRFGVNPPMQTQEIPTGSPV